MLTKAIIALIAAVLMIFVCEWLKSYLNYLDFKALWPSMRDNIWIRDKNGTIRRLSDEKGGNDRHDDGEEH